MAQSTIQTLYPFLKDHETKTASGCTVKSYSHDTGSGPVVCFVHGYPSSSYMYSTTLTNPYMLALADSLVVQVAACCPFAQGQDDNIHSGRLKETPSRLDSGIPCHARSILKTRLSQFPV